MKQQIDRADGLFKLTEFRDFMFDPVVLIGDLNDLNGKKASLSFPYWRKNNLLPFFPKGKWFEKVSFSQLIWLRIIDTLRQFSFKVTETQKVCDYFFKDAYDVDLAKQNLKSNEKTLLDRKVAGTISEEELVSLKWIESIKKDKVLQYLLKYDINYLTNLIADCVSTKEEAGILIYMNGDVIEYLGSEYRNHRDITVELSEPHIHLSIKHFLKEFIEDDELQQLILPRILNDDEKIVLKELRNKKIREISIRRKGNDTFRIDSNEMETISGDKAKEIKKILGMRNYEEISLSTIDDKTLNFKKTKKNINSD